MLTLLSGLSKFYYPRIYIVANSDDMSKEKIQSVEKQEVNKILIILTISSLIDTNVVLVLKT